MKYSLLTMFFIYTTAVGSNAVAAAWPQVKPLHKEILIDMRAPHKIYSIFIKSRSGRPLYRFVCEYGAQSLTTSVNSGGMICGMGSAKSNNEEILSNRTLLSSSNSAIYTRGNFNPEEISGNCATYPDYGVLREFRLRGMLIRIQLKDIEVNAGYNGGTAWRENFDFDSTDRSDYPIRTFNMVVDITPDALAINKFAEESRYYDPKGNQVSCASPKTRK